MLFYVEVAVVTGLLTVMPGFFSIMKGLHGVVKGFPLLVTGLFVGDILQLNREPEKRSVVTGFPLFMKGLANQVTGFSSKNKIPIKKTTAIESYSPQLQQLPKIKIKISSQSPMKTPVDPVAHCMLEPLLYMFHFVEH